MSDNVFHVACILDGESEFWRILQGKELNFVCDCDDGAIAALICELLNKHAREVKEAGND